MEKSPSLDGAYNLKTPQDSLRLYKEWADTYDDTFVAAHGYIMHEHVARAYVNAGGYQPVLDVGAGTGKCGEALRARGLDHVDATDISPEMLEIARGKDIYVGLFTGDILAGLDVADGAYAGVVSSGTFTHGHVGPEALDELLRVTRSGGWIAISINAAHYAAKGFEAKLAELEPHIRDFSRAELPIYSADALGDHAKDTGYVTVFRKR
jgi:predicted TPR repeat methyltransferase